VKNRRSLTPSVQTGPLGLHASRRTGARHGVSLRVVLKADSGRVHTGWALNVSRGGVRVILEESVELGSEFDVTMTTGADPATTLRGKVVWIQEEPDGVVCGLELRAP